MINLKDVIQRVCDKATLHRPYVFNMATVRAAVHTPITTHRLRITKVGATVFKTELIDSGGKLVQECDLGSAYARAGMISGTAFAKTQYGNVTEDPFFHELYDVQYRYLDYIEAGMALKKRVLSAPCMICGLVLPLRNLTVDHQRPQSGGETEAVLKTFRAFGLTSEGPQGPKGKSVMEHFTKGVPLQPVLTQPARAALGGSSLTDRYTLNDVGTLLYSFVVDAGELDTLKSECMHGLLNLKPACQTCNSSRGKQLKF